MSGKNSRNCLVKKVCNYCSSEFDGHFNAKLCEQCSNDKTLSKCIYCKTVKKRFIYIKGAAGTCLSCFESTVIPDSRMRFNDSNQYEWVECRECGYRAEDITPHLKSYHAMTSLIYKEKHNGHITKSQKLADAYRGENNPGYQHEGKFSPWSTKSEYHDSETISESKKLAIENSKIPEKMSNRIEYWLAKGLSIEEANDALSERQTTFSLEKCIQRYGKIEGVSVWKQRQEKWQNTLQNKTNEEKKRINYLRATNGGRDGAISGYEREIADYLNGQGIKIETQYILDRGNNHFYLYDFRFGSKIVEFHGNYWHCNPALFEHDYFNTSIGASAFELWEKDRDKKSFAESKGFDVFILWERDYNMNKLGQLKRCLDFLTQ